MIASQNSTERREDPRLKNNIPIKIFQEDGDLVTETQNISRSGVYCCVNRYIAPMTKLKVHLLLSIPPKGKNTVKKISCHGIVVRSEPLLDSGQYHIAVFFNDITPKESEYLMDYVNTYLTV